MMTDGYILECTIQQLEKNWESSFKTFHTGQRDRYGRIQDDARDACSHVEETTNGESISEELEASKTNHNETGAQMD